MTPEYFVRAGVIERAPAAADVDLLLRRALDTLAYVPFGLAVDRWRWGVFSGEAGVDGVQPDVVGVAPLLSGGSSCGASQ